jgi:hypothetical protein
MVTSYFTFETTHHALWAEEVARARQVPVEVVPAPPGLVARCNLALVTLPEEHHLLVKILHGEDIPFLVVDA